MQGTEKETPEEEENQERKCSRSGQSFQKGGRGHQGEVQQRCLLE